MNSIPAIFPREGAVPPAPILAGKSGPGWNPALPTPRRQSAAVQPALSLLLLLLPLASLDAQPFVLPTANQAIYELGGEANYYVGTAGKPWTSGLFGCARSGGWQLHEGIDIRCVQRDRSGEPLDPVLATAEGTVVYMNKRPSLSNYGNYLILRHVIEGLEVYSLYAHLREIRRDLTPGKTVRAGEPIAVMGRTANTAQAISKDRAHVHFELDLVLNERFPEWYRKTFPGQRNDHGPWNGQNLVALDPREILLAQRQQGERFSLAQWLRGQTELARVQVRDTNFPWLIRYAALIETNPLAAKEGAAGYELALNFNGVPFRLVPRAPSELKSKARIHLLSVNESEYRRAPCRRLIVKRGARWELANNGLHLLNLLTY